MLILRPVLPLAENARRLAAVTLVALLLGSAAAACGDAGDPAGAGGADTGIGGGLPPLPGPDGGVDADGGSDPDPDADAGPGGGSDEDGGSAGDTDAGDPGDGGTDPGDGGTDADTGGGDPLPPGAVRRPAPPEVIQTCTTLEPTPDGATCRVAREGTTAATVLRGTVLTPEGQLLGGEVMVGATGLIACVGCSCATTPGYGEASIVECPTGVISPGLVNGHDHITYTQNAPAPPQQERYEHRHDWRRGLRGHTPLHYVRNASTDQRAWGELRQFIGGTTALAGSGVGPGLLRNLDRPPADQLGINQGRVEYSTFPLDDSEPRMRVDDCNYGSGRDTTAVLRSSCYLPHVAEGIDREARNEFLCMAYNERGGIDLVEPNTAIIHAVGLLAQDGREMAVNSTSVIWTPRSNIVLYGNTAPVTMYHNQGVLLGLGTDWTFSGSINMLRELACAAYLNDTHFDGFFTDRELWFMATAGNALALAVDSAVGSLVTGLHADIAVFERGDAPNPYRAILEADTLTTRLVMRGGRIFFGEPSLDRAFLQPPGGCDTFELCETPRFVCVQGETGRTFSALQTGAGSAYGLAFCGTPPNEPTCVPFRDDSFGRYGTDPVTGDVLTQDNDQDGDGVPDDVDNCPTIFNAIRPVDRGAQADADGDGVGDVCDPCPQAPDTTTCPPINPLDSDGDGIPNSADNCPLVFNPDQLDRDGDGKGDACDACPSDPNPGPEACPFTIYDIKRAVMPNGTRVRFRGVVTALAGNRLFVQVPEADRDPALGARFSGVFVFLPGTLPAGIRLPALGDQVTVQGSTALFFGQRQVTNVTALVNEGTGVPPEPIVVNAADVATGGPRAADYEAVLVQVQGVEVLSLTPPPAPSYPASLREYTVTGNLRVDSTIFDSSPSVVVGDRVNITGVVVFTFSHSRLYPRSADDVEVVDDGQVRLGGFNPPDTFLFADGPWPVADIRLRTLRPVADTTPVAVRVQPTRPDVVLPTLAFPAGQREIPVPLALTGAPADGTPFSFIASVPSNEATLRVFPRDRLLQAAFEDGPDEVEARRRIRVPLTLAEPNPLASPLPVPVRIDVPAFPGGDPDEDPPPPLVGDARVVGTPTALPGETEVLIEIEGLVEGFIDLVLDDPFVPARYRLQVLPATSLDACLIFSEYLEGNSNNKAIEVWNCGADPFDLTGVFIGLQNEKRVNATNSLQALRGVLGPDDVLCFSNRRSVAALNARCPVDSPVANFNGNDRLVLYRELNGTVDFQPDGDQLLDAWGQWNVLPSRTPWADNTWRRCVSTDPFLSDGPFSPAAFYTTHRIDNFAGLGLSPRSDCE